MMHCACALLLMLLVGEEGFRVELTNRREYLAREAVCDGRAWVFSFESGSMSVPVDQVKSVTQVDATGNARAGKPAAASQTPASLPRLEQTHAQKFSLSGKEFQVTLPAAFSRAEPEEPAIIAFISKDQTESVRFARSEVKGSLWEIGGGVKALHENNYHEFKVLSEHFTAFQDHPAWILCFTYRKGESNWQECQGFVEFAGEIVVISATAPAERVMRCYQLVQAAGNSLGLGNSLGATPKGNTR